jgi:hypothetical protein
MKVSVWIGLQWDSAVMQEDSTEQFTYRSQSGLTFQEDPLGCGTASVVWRNTWSAMMSWPNICLSDVKSLCGIEEDSISISVRWDERLK